jgi:hypothetical protein
MVETGSKEERGWIPLEIRQETRMELQVALELP